MGDLENAKKILEEAISRVDDKAAILARIEAISGIGTPHSERIDHDDGSYSIINFNDRGLQASDAQYKSDGTEIYRVEYTYDNKNKLVSGHYVENLVDARGMPYYEKNEVLYDEYGRAIYLEKTTIYEDRNSIDRFTYNYTPDSTNVGIDIESPERYDGIWHLDYEMEDPESQVYMSTMGGGNRGEAGKFVCGFLETPAFIDSEFYNEYYEIYTEYSYDGNVINREKREGWPQE